MKSTIIQLVIMLHAAFGVMFVFFYRQHRNQFSRLIAQSWLLEALRAYINLTQLADTGGWVNHWHSLSDCLGIFATWWLLSGCASLVDVKLPPRLGRYYIGLSVPVILGLRYLAPQWLPGWTGLPVDRVGFLSVFAELVFIFVPVTLARAVILYWFIGLWRRSRLPGALLASIFGVPYVAFAVLVPIQFYLTYYPEWIYFLWSARVLGFSLGLVMLLFDRQLLAQREGEQVLRESEVKFHAVFAQSPLAIVLTTLPEGRVADANQAAEKLLGYSLVTVRGQTTTEMGIWASLADRDRYLQMLQADSGVNGYEARMRVQSGAILDVLFHGRVVHIDGKSYVLNSLLDITERRKAEELVRHLAAFPELNPNPVLEFNRDGSLAYQNPAAVSMAKKVGQAGIEQLLPPGAAGIVADCLAGGRPRLRLETVHGRHTLSWSFYPIAGQQVVHCYVGDVTDRQSLEEQLRQAQKMEAVGQLAGGVAHDFNNMLTAIIGHLGLLRSNPQITREIDESLSEISLAANRAARLTSQLLAFSRRQVLSTEALDLNEVVTHLTKMLRRILGEQVSMQLDFSSEPLVFHGDAGLMEQVLINLAVNARDAMPEGGILRISTRAEPHRPPASPESREPAPVAGYVRLTVSDTGTGIPPEIRAKIFEPFFTTKEVGKGTGLGLATVFGIVQQHRGWIEVESEPGRGAAFHIFLPRLAAAPSPAPAPQPVFAPRGQNELVLLVEDEPAVQEMGAEALRRQGYRVMTAANGRAALEIWARHKDEIDLLLTDMIMPEGLSGQQLASRLLGEKPGLKVIYSSGYNAEIAGKELKLTDGVNYLAKPYELDRLYRTVRTALERAHSRPPF